jgi:hypothetical protein
MLCVEPTCVVFESARVCGIDGKGDIRDGLPTFDTANPLAPYPLTRIVRGSRQRLTTRQRFGIRRQQRCNGAPERLKEFGAPRSVRIVRIACNFAHQVTAARGAFLNSDSSKGAQGPMAEDVHRTVGQEFFGHRDIRRQPKGFFRRWALPAMACHVPHPQSLPLACFGGHFTVP